jgi:purine-binding chemotaxis protein CheW
MISEPTTDLDQADRINDADRIIVEEECHAVDDQRLQEVYRERARQFAARSTVTKRAPNTRPVLTFLAGSERFGITTDAVVEVLKYERCAPILGAGQELLGVMNIRGRVCSVLDLAQVLELPHRSESLAGHVVLVRHAGFEIGLRVDEVEQIEPVSIDQLDGLDSDPDDDTTRYVLGRKAGRLTVLDIDVVFSHHVFRRGRDDCSRVIPNLSVDRAQPRASLTKSSDRSLVEGALA